MEVNLKPVFLGLNYFHILTLIGMSCFVYFIKSNKNIFSTPFLVAISMTYILLEVWLYKHGVSRSVYAILSFVNLPMLVMVFGLIGVGENILYRSVLTIFVCIFATFIFLFNLVAISVFMANLKLFKFESIDMYLYGMIRNFLFVSFLSSIVIIVIKFAFGLEAREGSGVVH